MKFLISAQQLSVSQYIEGMSISIWVFFSFQIAASSPDANLQNPYQLINTETRKEENKMQEPSNFQSKDSCKFFNAIEPVKNN
jgi:hypothetical protein